MSTTMSAVFFTVIGHRSAPRPSDPIICPLNDVFQCLIALRAQTFFFVLREHLDLFQFSLEDLLELGHEWRFEL
jgi:hypothetical protein